MEKGWDQYMFIAENDAQLPYFCHRVCRFFFTKHLHPPLFEWAMADTSTSTLILKTRSSLTIIFTINHIKIKKLCLNIVRKIKEDKLIKLFWSLWNNLGPSSIITHIQIIKYSFASKLILIFLLFLNQNIIRYLS